MFCFFLGVSLHLCVCFKRCPPHISVWSASFSLPLPFSPLYNLSYNVGLVFLKVRPTHSRGWRRDDLRCLKRALKHQNEQTNKFTVVNFVFNMELYCASPQLGIVDRNRPVTPQDFVKASVDESLELFCSVFRVLLPESTGIAVTDLYSCVNVRVVFVRSRVCVLWYFLVTSYWAWYIICILYFRKKDSWN